MKKKLVLDKKMHHKVSFWLTGTIWVLSAGSSGLAALYNAKGGMFNVPPWASMLLLSIIFLGAFLGTMLRWESGDD